MKEKKAIVTLAIGKVYRERWHKLCHDNWHHYAELHGYDLICIDSPLDTSFRAQSRPVNWQKCLILSNERVKKYDRVVWIDSDILINPNSPCIVSEVPEHKIGAVDQFADPLMEVFPKGQRLMDRAVEFWNWSFCNAKELYLQGGLPDTYDNVVQTGVMVLSPDLHRYIMEDTYYKYEGDAGVHAEMECLSYQILKENCIYWLDYRFNRLWFECLLRDYPFLLPGSNPENRAIRAWKRLTRGNPFLPPKKIATACLSTAFINNYFLHFAGSAEYMPWVDTSIDNWVHLRNKV